MNNLRDFMNFIDTIDQDIEIMDSFDIELQDCIIESGIVGFAEDGFIIECDDVALEILKNNGAIFEPITEAKYHGREVKLGKPSPGDVKKSKVYVRGPTGKVVKVNFGDKTMRIKKSNPARRKSFRARHHCENPGPRWKARYWSCRAW